MVNRDIVNLELSLKQREESLKAKKHHLYIVRDEYEQLTKKSKFFFSEVAELMSQSDDSYYFKDLESQHRQASRKLQTYFQELEVFGIRLIVAVTLTEIFSKFQKVIIHNGSANVFH